MNDCKDLNEMKNHENIANNGCDVRWENCSSQELFSDDDQLKNSFFFSPNGIKRNETLNSSIISLKTPVLCSKVNEETPGKAKVPNTPAGLQAFITKTSILWTSDMETPQSVANESKRSESCNKTVNSVDIVNNTTPTRRLCTPTPEKMNVKKIDITSPILGGKKRSKRKVKRRILNNLGLDVDNNNDQQASISSNSDKIASETASTGSNECALDVESEINKSKENNALTAKEDNGALSDKENTKECNTPVKKNNNPLTTEENNTTNKISTKESKSVANEEINENKKLEEGFIFDKNSNTSTQEFFCNASFSSIDKLCSTAMPEQKTNLTPITEESKCDSNINIKKDVNDIGESKPETNISNSVLERVAAIRRNQKPLRRSSDINHTVIPKEVFSMSARELELADAKFCQENKITSEIQNNPLAKRKSFTTLAALENELQVVKEKSPDKKNKMNSFSQDVLAEIMEDWSSEVDFNQLLVKNEQIEEPTELDNEIDFSKASGAKITVDENSLKRRMKIFNEIEKEIGSSDDFMSMKKSNLRKNLNPLKLPVNKINLDIVSKSCLGDKLISNIKKETYDDNDSLVSENANELLKQSMKQPKVEVDSLNPNNVLFLNDNISSKLSNVDFKEETDGFSTASGKNITVSEDKILDYAKVYNEIENSDPKTDIKFPKTNRKTHFSALGKLNLKPDLSKLPMKQPKLEIASSNSNIKSDHQELINNNLPNSHNNFEGVIDGFSTANGKNIIVNEAKLLDYAKVYDELKNENLDEKSFLGFKKNHDKPKRLSLNFRKNSISKQSTIINIENKDKSSATLQNNKYDKGKKSEVLKLYHELDLEEFLEPKFTPESTDSVDDGFSTATGKGIKINEEMENHYFKIYNKLNVEIPRENVSSNEKVSVVSNKRKSDNLPVNAKLSMRSDTDKAFSVHLSDVYKLSDLSNKTKTLDDKETEKENGFIAPNSTHVLKKINQTSTIAQKIDDDSSIIKKRKYEEDLHEVEKKIELIKSNINLSKDEQEKKILELKNLNKEKSQVGMFKRRLENCESKRPERCRSFGGFPVDNKGISAKKLNQSDPLNESINQPVKKGLSVSQCFDSHSDSWLSKVELSYLNNSKVKSPDLRVENNRKNVKDVISKDFNNQKLDESNECLGFSYKECTESFRFHAKFKNFLEKHCNYVNNSDLCIESGQTISICNSTSSKQQICIYCKTNININENENKPNYVLVESEPKIVNNQSNNLNSKIQEETDKTKKQINLAGKRKHVDTDSDTPLSTIKKPRVGSELLGRKLFSDESDVESEVDNNLNNQIEKLETLTALKDVNIPDPQEEEALLEERIDLYLQQEKMIRNKKRMKVKPIMGSLLRERLVNNKNRISWSELVGNSVPTGRNIEEIKENHLDAKILEVNPSNATCYKFLSSNFINGKRVVSLDVGDGALLIFDEKGHAGVTEFSEAFLAMSGVDEKLLPTGWIENHYKWIIWKLASMDRMNFNSTQLPKMLTPERVMKELKYRYDREIDKAQRPALRKILEKDDVPTRRMVLCVSSIKENISNEDTEKEVKSMLGISRWKIEATDGWYSIPLTIDSAMANFISNGKVKEGTKIITYGAELLNCEKGFFPLEVPTNVSLKIHTNCTRRARWDTKLGYQKNPKPFPIKLKNIISNGGMVGEITAVAARVYPLLYREKTPSGQSIYRNARSEEKAAIAHERALELKADAIYAEAEKKFDSKKKSDSDPDETENSPESQTESKTIRNSHNDWERKTEKFKQKLESQVREGLPPPRQVTAVLKIRLVDDKTTAILTIWGASEDSGYDIKEGNTITIYNSFASGIRGSELNLTANRMTHIKKETLLKLSYPNRTCTLIPEMISPNFQPNFYEFDTVGVVVSSGPAPHGMKNFEMVNIAYPGPENSGSSYLAILFWSGVSSFGYQGIFTVGACVACSNLEWRRNTSWSIAVAYCSEKSIFTSNPRQQHLMNELKQLKALLQNPVTYAESCAEDVSYELTKKPQSRSSQSTPTNFPDRSSLHNNTTLASPMDNYSPNSTAIQRRLEKLSRYGSCASDISPIVLKNTSDKVKKDFTPVTRKDT